MAHQPVYRLIDHTADMGFDVWGGSPADLFQNAAHALFTEMTDLAAVKTLETRPVRIKGADLAELLHDWLAELLYLFEVEGVVFSRFTVKHVSQDGLQAEAAGEPFDPDRHPVLSAVKAVTRHQLGVTEESGRWTARVIFDV